MQRRSGRTRLASSASAAFNSANVTAAVGMGETAGRLRARRSSLFTQTVIWVTALICMAFLLGTLAQAWSNSQSAQQVQAAQQQLQSIQRHHSELVKASSHYQDPSVVESEARQQLGYTRPGEHPVIIVGSNDSQQQTTKKQVAKQEDQNFWQAWWNAFFGR